MSEPGHGRLKVVMPPAWRDLRPHVNVIDSETLALVATSRCNEPVAVPAGRYMVSATLPNGERTMGVVDVDAGGHHELGLDAPEPATAKTAAPTAGDPSRPGRAVTRGRPAPAWYIRFFESYPGAGYTLTEPEVEVEPDVPGAAGIALKISPRGGGVLVAQLAFPGAVPLNVALPVNGMTSVQSCRLTVAVEDGAVTGDVSLPENPRVDAVANYLMTGNLRDAGHVLGDAEGLLEQKMADPFAAALGGYALVRQRRLDLLHHWPRNLSSMFPWFPDGAIIAGEEAALEGDHAIAVRELCDGARRGLPVFADGCSILMSRLREYAKPKDDAAADARPVPHKPPPGVDTADLEEAAVQLERLQPLAPFVNFARIVLAFRAARPDDVAGSQTPFDPRPGEGWQRYDPRAPTGLSAVA